MADMPPDMNCADMAGDFPPPPTDFGEFMNECPPYGDYAGGDNYDAAAHPHEGDMPGDPGPGTAPPGSPPPGDMGPGPVTAPGEAPPTFDGGEGPGTAPPDGLEEMQSTMDDASANAPVTAPGEAPPTFDGDVADGPGTVPPNDDTDDVV